MPLDLTQVQGAQREAAELIKVHRRLLFQEVVLMMCLGWVWV